jgi:putative PIN family toxin of toxin-antitoxin system
VRVVLDANVLISAFASKGLCAELFRDVLASHQLFLSDYLLGEVHRNLVGKLGVPEPIARDIRDLLAGLVVCPGEQPPVDAPIRDPDDVPVVSFALAVGADVLVTGDRDLLDVASELPLAVVLPRAFYGR